ncbi:MAG: hypothetical protein PHD61_04550 [Bacteroidales bacterium]|nr:hypothetical protein [Lentimicrobiaceae bacterium]MDD5694559.1 hypothetical protein [Bacteroidales bacterium]
MSRTNNPLPFALRMLGGIILAALVPWWVSCNQDDESLIPSYVQIEEVTLLPNPSIQHLHGSLSHQITDVWIYVEDGVKQEFIGVYELPVTFPVLKEGPYTLLIRAGIKVNGIAETRGEYPFYTDFKKQVNFVRDSVINIKPSFKYEDFCEFVWLEDFEDANVSVSNSSRSDTSMTVTSQPGEVFEQEYSGKVSLDSERFFFECFSSQAFDLPGKGTEVYLEMNFKTNTEVTVGLMVNFLVESILAPVVILNETDEWKKIYISMKNVVSTYSTAISFNVFFSAVKPAEVTESLILIDNVKLIHK